MNPDLHAGPWFSPEHPPRRRGWNAMCVAAFASTALGIVVFWPLMALGFVLGFVGMVQVRRSRERGLALAVLAILPGPLMGGLLIVAFTIGAWWLPHGLA